MRAVVQRVSRANVLSEGELCGEIKRGLMILLGVADGDTEDDAAYLAEKIVGLRIFPDAEDKMNLSLLDISGEALIVSQFTLLGDCRRGRRPSFSSSASAEQADRLYQIFCKDVFDKGIPVQTGVFQTHMQVELVNDGPVTLILDSRKQF